LYNQIGRNKLPEEEVVAMITQIYTEVILPGEEIPDLFE